MARMREVVIASLMAIGTVQGLSTQQDIWQSHLDIAGQTTSWRKGAGAYLFMPILQDPCQLVFGQVKGGHFLDSWIGSVGIGYRKLQSKNWAWGLNGFFDLSRSDNHLTHVQGSVGAELFGRCWEARINGYFPSLKRKIVKTEHVTETFLDGTQLFRADYTRKTQEAAYRGVDAEIGYGFDVCGGSLWGYAGYYYFSTNKQCSFDGPRLRVEYRLDNILGWCGVQALAGVIWEHDQIHGNKTSLALGFRVPLGCPAKSDCCPTSSIYRRMGNRVRRIESIVIAEKQKRVGQVNTPILSPDGSPLQVFFAAQNGTGPGSLEEPASLEKVAALANPYDHIVLIGNQGTETLTLKNHQSLYGFGNNENLTIDLPSGPITFSDDHGRAHLKGDLTLANHNRLQGFSLEGGIQGTDLNDVTIQNLAVNASKGDGIALSNSQHALIDSVIIRDAAGRGMIIDGKDHLVRNVSVERAGQAGVIASNTRLDDVRIQNAKEEGLILKGGNVQIGSLEITHSGKTALKIQGTNDVVAKELFLNSHEDGLQITDSVGNVHLGNVQIRAQQKGMYLARNAASITVDALDVVGKQAALVADGQKGLFKAHKATLVASQGPAIHFKEANVEISTLSLISKQSKTPSIYLENTFGKLNLQGAFIDHPIHIKGGGALFSYNGTISNPKGNILHVDGVKRGNVEVRGTHAGLVGKSLLIQDSGCIVKVDGALLTDTIKRDAHTGHFSLYNSRIQGRENLKYGLLSTNTVGLSLKNVIFTGVSTAVELQNVQGMHLIHNITAYDFNGYGIVVNFIPKGVATLDFSRNNCTGALENNEVSIAKALNIFLDKPYPFVLNAQDNRFFGIKEHAICLKTSPEVSLPKIEFNVHSNQITDSDQSAIFMFLESLSHAKTDIRGHLANNTFHNTGWTPKDAAILIKTNLRSYKDRMNVSIENNDNVSGRSAIAIAADILSKGTTNLTLKKNRDHQQPFGFAYQIGNSGPGDLHLKIEENTSERLAPAILLINKGSGRFFTNQSHAKTRGKIEIN